MSADTKICKQILLPAKWSVPPLLCNGQSISYSVCSRGRLMQSKTLTSDNSVLDCHISWGTVSISSILTCLSLSSCFYVNIRKIVVGLLNNTFNSFNRERSGDCQMSRIISSSPLLSFTRNHVVVNRTQINKLNNNSESTSPINMRF